MSLDCYAICPPGVEAITAGELTGLNLRPTATEPGGVSFRTDRAGLYRANLHLRTANRVSVRVAEFPATTFPELERRARRISWESVVPVGAAVAFRVTCRKSKLYHAGAVEQRLVEAAERGGHGTTAGAPQEFIVRVYRDQVTVSADSSGELLHMRGYRLATAKAPLRETLAAAVILGSGWDRTSALIDPMCGAGTIPIEAALLARGMAPGRSRHFGFEQWPDFDATLWGEIRAQAEERVLAGAPGLIRGSDRDAGAISAAESNAARAGVAGDIIFHHGAVSALEAPPGMGWVVTNPPYGVRVGEADKLRDLFARFGQVLRTRCPGWQVAMLSGNRALEAQVGLGWEDRFRTNNGGIPVRLVRGRVPT